VGFIKLRDSFFIVLYLPVRIEPVLREACGVLAFDFHERNAVDIEHYVGSYVIPAVIDHLPADYELIIIHVIKIKEPDIFHHALFFGILLGRRT